MRSSKISRISVENRSLATVNCRRKSQFGNFTRKRFPNAASSKSRRIAFTEKSDLPPLIFKPHTVTNRSLIIRLLQSGHRKSVVIVVVVSRRKSHPEFLQKLVENRLECNFLKKLTKILSSNYNYRLFMLKKVMPHIFNN